MAEALLQYYKYISEHAGATGRTKLAMETKIPSTRAAMEPDSPANLKLFQGAVAKITGEPAPVLR